MKKSSIELIKEDIKNDKNAKKEYEKMLDEETKRKHNLCITNGRFDYLKLSELYHNGEW